jgi:hypothetical protein
MEAVRMRRSSDLLQDGNRRSGETEEEHRLFIVRYMQFHNIWTLYRDFISGHYVPSVSGYVNKEDKADWRLPAGFQYTLMFVLYSFFYSLIDDDSSSTNAFRIWRAKYPNEELAIAAVEFRVIPIKPYLRTFRNKVGFHGSRSSARQEPGLDLFGAHSGTKMLNVIKQFKALNAALLELEMATTTLNQSRIANARLMLDQITSRCSSTSTTDFDNNELEPIGM